MVSARDVLSWLLLVSTGALSSCTAGMNAAEKMMWSTYPLATQKGEATGFIINRRREKSTKHRKAVMFTSSHVLDTLGKGPLLVVLRSGESNAMAEPLYLVLTPPKGMARRFYVTHPHHDIAAFSIRLPDEMAEIVQARSFLEEGMLEQDGSSLRSGEEVAFLGYPDVLPGTEGAFPVLRSGRVASYPVRQGRAGGRFLINSDVYPGDSGAPVILAGRSDRPHLVGMVIQRVSPEADRFSHLAVAIDAEVIRETLKLLTQTEKKPLQIESRLTPQAPSCPRILP